MRLQSRIRMYGVSDVCLARKPRTSAVHSLLHVRDRSDMCTSVALTRWGFSAGYAYQVQDVDTMLQKNITRSWNSFMAIADVGHHTFLAIVGKRKLGFTNHQTGIDVHYFQRDRRIGQARMQLCC